MSQVREKTLSAICAPLIAIKADDETALACKGVCFNPGGDVLLVPIMGRHPK